MIHYLSESELISGLENIKKAPKEGGILELIVVRTAENERITLTESAVSARHGVHGDRWASTSWKTLPDGQPEPAIQITLMNSRCIALLAQEQSRWALAGDQLYVDLDLSEANLPVGQRLVIGSAILEITSERHTGCAKFSQRFGPAALAFVNSPEGMQLHLRGIYAKVVQDGSIRVGEQIIKL